MFIDNEITSGGGFNQAINSIINLKKIQRNKFLIEIVTSKKENLLYLHHLKIKSSYIKISFFDYLFSFLTSSKVFCFLQQKIRLISPLESKLIKRECDLVYFVTPSILALSLQKLNYIFTLWDLCHLENLEFPEVRFFGKFLLRDEFFKKAIHSSFLNITESRDLNKIASAYFGLNIERFLAIPLSPSPFFGNIEKYNKFAVLKKYNLTKDYFFYPAQFWPHKNHIRILQALLILRLSHNIRPNVVFSGKDYGNLNYIRSFINKNKLDSQVKILGFVSPYDITGLYLNSSALVMPTYFGPSNIPPLEAWSLGVPVIYPFNLSKDFEKAVILINQDDKTSLAYAFMEVMKPKVRKKLIAEGYEALKRIEKNRALALNQLFSKLEKFSNILETWHSSD